MAHLMRETIKRLIPERLLVRRLRPRADNSILLTFDDGPDPAVTVKVLELLKAFGVRAVFFVVGKRAARAPHLLKDIVLHGHEIGNHTFTHSNHGEPGFWAYRRDLERCQRIIAEHTGLRPRLFRPPSGHISLASLVVPRMAGMRPVNWSVGVRDWSCRTSDQAKRASRDLIERANVRDILVLHDDNPYVVNILEEVLPVLQSRGYDLSSGCRYL